MSVASELLTRVNLTRRTCSPVRGSRCTLAKCVVVGNAVMTARTAAPEAG
ncbi:MAG: hypothetical protein ACLTMP_03690 [Eggerthella lenta]